MWLYMFHTAAGIIQVFKIPYHKSQCLTGAKFHGITNTRMCIISLVLYMYKPNRKFAMCIGGGAAGASPAPNHTHPVLALKFIFPTLMEHWLIN